MCAHLSLFVPAPFSISARISSDHRAFFFRPFICMAVFPYLFLFTPSAILTPFLGCLFPSHPPLPILPPQSPLLSQYLVRKDVIAHLVHMYLGVRSPADKEKTGLPSLPVMGSSSGGSFDDLINTITLLLATKERLPPLTSKLLEIHLVQRPVEPPSLPIMSNFAAKVFLPPHIFLSLQPFPPCGS